MTRPGLLQLIVLLGAMVLLAAPASAQTAEEVARAHELAVARGEGGLGAAGLGAGLAAGLAVIGAGIGIGLIGSRSNEAVARQPEMAGRIFINMILTAALVEGVALFAVVVGLLKFPY
jgi:F-type H+-transporting ATPase subunit c